MRKLKMACLNTEEVGDRFCLILRQYRHSAAGQDSENETCMCACADGADEAVEVHKSDLAKGTG